MDKQTIIFDFDGTLADSFELVLDIAYKLTGHVRLPDAEIVRLKSLPPLKVLHELKISLVSVPRLLLKGRKEMQLRMPEVHAFAGVPELLLALHNAGHQLLVISSNSEHNVRTFLKANNLEQYFTQVHGGVGILDKSKALKKVLRRGHLVTRDCYYVGDEVRDIQAAQKVGLKIISVSWGYQARETLAAHHPDILADSPSEISEAFTVLQNPPATV